MGILYYWFLEHILEFHDKIESLQKRVPKMAVTTVIVLPKLIVDTSFIRNYFRIQIFKNIVIKY